jgi:hypothetical protein
VPFAKSAAIWLGRGAVVAACVGAGATFTNMYWAGAAPGKAAISAQPPAVAQVTTATVPTAEPAPKSGAGVDGPNSSPPTLGAAGEGSLEVYVPPVPPQPVIDHLCQDLTSGTRAEPATWLPDLIVITGGTTTSTTKWCRTYLHIWSGRGSPPQS